MTELVHIAVGSLVVWRLTHLFWGEDGPFGWLAAFRRKLGEGWFGQLVDCFYCLSFWIAAPLAYVLGTDMRERLLLWPALSGAAILLERATHRAPAPPAAVWREIQSKEN